MGWDGGYLITHEPLQYHGAREYTTKRAKRYTSVTLFLLAGVAAAFVVGTVAVRVAAAAVADTVRDRTLDWTRNRLGVDLSWREIEPRLLGGLRVHGARAGGLASVGTVAVALDWIALIGGPSESGIPRVSVHDATVDLRGPDRRAELDRLIAFLSELTLAPGDTLVELVDAVVRYSDPNGAEYEVADLHARADMTTEGSVWAGRGTLTADEAAPIGAARGAFVFRVRSELDTPQTVIDATLLGVSSEAVDLAKTTARVTITSDTIAVLVLPDVSGIEATLAIDRSSGAKTVGVRAAGVVLDDIAALKGPLAPFGTYLSRPVALEADARLTSDWQLSDGEVRLTTTVGGDPLPAPLPLTVVAAYADRRLTVEELRVRGQGGSMNITGSYHDGRIAARMQLDRFAYAGVPPTSGVFTVGGSMRDLWARSPGLLVNGFTFHDLAITVESGARYADLGVGFALTASGDDAVVASARVESARDLVAELHLTALPIDRVLAALQALGVDTGIGGGTPIAARLDGSVELNRSGGEIALAVPRLEVRGNADPRTFVHIAGTFREGTIHIATIRGNLGGARIDGSTIVRFGSFKTIDTVTDLRIDGIDYGFRALFSPRDGLRVSGPHGLDVQARSVAGGGIEIAGILAPTPLPVGNAQLSAEFDGRFLNAAQWSFNAQNIVIEDLPLAGRGFLSGRFALAATPGTIEIAVIDAGDSVSRLVGSITAQIGGLTDVQVVGRLAAPTGEERYRFAARLADDETTLDLRFEASPVRRWYRGANRGSLGGVVQVFSGSDRFESRLSIASDGIIVNGQEIVVALTGKIDERGVVVSEAEFAVETSRLSVETLQFDRTDGALDARATISGVRGSRTTDILVTATADPLPRLSAAALAKLRFSARVKTAERDSGRELIYRIDRSSEAFKLQREDGGLVANLRNDGSFDAVATEPSVATFTAEGRLSYGNVEMSVSGLRTDVARLFSSDRDGDFAAVAGLATGSLRFVGPISDPDAFGTLQIQGLEVAAPFTPQPLIARQTAFIAEGKQLRLRPTAVSAGSATAQLSGAAILSRYAIAEYRLRLVTTSEEGIHIVDQFGLVDVDGFVTGELTISGVGDVMRFEGNLVASRTDFAVLDTDDQAQEDDLDLLVDLTIETGRAVQFLWPAADLPIIRGTIATGQRVRLQLDSGLQTFALDGAVAIQSGTIFYFDRNFLLRKGSIRFQETQDSFDPLITTRAELREATREGAVRIFLVAENQRLNDFSPRLSSSPPLPASRIVAILGGNILKPSESGDVSVAAALLSTSDIVTQFALFQQFEESVRERFDLDLFAVRTSALQNVLINAIDNRAQTGPTLGTFLNNTAIFAGRYIGDAVFSQVLVELRNSEAGVNPFERSATRVGGVLIDSEIRLEWQTPLFLLEWKLAPRNPEELFIRDNTFGLSWNFSY